MFPRMTVRIAWSVLRRSAGSDRRYCVTVVGVACMDGGAFPQVDVSVACAPLPVQPARASACGSLGSDRTCHQDSSVRLYDRARLMLPTSIDRNAARGDSKRKVEFLFPAHSDRRDPANCLQWTGSGRRLSRDCEPDRHSGEGADRLTSSMAPWGEGHIGFHFICLQIPQCLCRL